VVSAHFTKGQKTTPCCRGLQDGDAMTDTCSVTAVFCACAACQQMTFVLYTLSDGRHVCRACYDAAQPWRVEDGTRENYLSALTAIKGGGYEASARMIESYVERLEGQCHD
jgi:hypothetical protein